MQHPLPKAPQRRAKGLLLVLCLLLLAAAGFVWRAANHPATPAASNDMLMVEMSSLSVLALHEAQHITTVDLFPSGAEPYTLHMKDDTFCLRTVDGWEPISETYGKALLGVCTKIVSQETVVDDITKVQLADMGLAPAKAAAVLHFADGHEERLEVGAQAPHSTFHYFRWSGASGVYLCDAEVFEALNFTINRLHPVEQMPINVSLVDHLVIRNKAVKVVLQFDGLTGAQMESPYRYPLDAAAANMLLSSLANFRLGTKETALTVETCAVYGLDDPLCEVEVHQRAGSVSGVAKNGALIAESVPETTLSFALGREEGKYFYTCVYDEQIYLVSRFLTQALISVSAESLLTLTPADMGDIVLSHILVQTPDGTAEVCIERREQVLPNNVLATDESGNLRYDVRFFLNAEETTQEVVDLFRARLSSMKVSGKAPEGWVIPDTPPRWSVQLTAQTGEVRTVEGYRLDLFTDVVALNGVALHTMDVQTIETAVQGCLKQPGS